MPNTSISKLIENTRLEDIGSLTLDNGLRIFVRENNKAPVVSVQFWVKTGSIHEDVYLGCGLSHFLEHMIFFGTSKNPDLNISDEVQKFGGDINAYTSYGCTVYHIDAPIESFERSVELLSDVISTPLFPEKKFEDEKNVILRERAMGLDNPGRMLSEKTWLELFHIHPARHPIIGYKQKIESVDRAVMLDYYDKRYSPHRSFVVVSGDISAEKVFQVVEKHVGNWAIGRMDDPFIPPEPPRLAARDVDYTFEDPLSRFSIAFHAPPANHQDVAALDVLSGVLSQGKTSRLVDQLQSKKHLAINVDAFNYTPYFCGVFGVSCLCEPEKSAELESEVLVELKKIITGGVDKEELNRVLNQQLTDFLRGMNSNQALAQIIGNSVLSYDNPAFAMKYVADLVAVNSKDIVRCAETYLDPDKRTTIRLKSATAKKAKGKSSDKNGKNDLPDVRREQLKTGQRLLFYTDSTLPLVDVCVIMPGGSIMENRENAGISSMLASVMMTGAGKFDEFTLSRLLDSYGINTSIVPGNNTFSLRMNFHKDNLNVALRGLKAILGAPTFPDKEFERERTNRLNRLKSRKLSPKHAAEDALCELIYGDHPYSLPTVGLVESVEKLTPAKIRDFYFNTCLNPREVIFSIGGDIAGIGARKMLDSLIKSIPWSKKTKSSLPEKPRFLGKEVEKRVTLPREQAVVLYGFPGCDMKNDDRFSLDVLQTAMNGLSTRLFKKIREDEGLAYYTGLLCSRGRQEGYVAFYAGTDPKRADDVIQLISEERALLIKSGLTAEEVKSAKACIKFEVAEQMLSSRSLTFNAALCEFYGNDYLEPWRCGDIIQKLTLKTINQVIKRYLSQSGPATVVAGP